MGWSRKGKFGIHSGRTLRSSPSRKYCTTSYFRGKSNSCNELVVVKELLEHHPDNPSATSRSNKIFDFDDGIPLSNQFFQPSRIRGYPAYPVFHSLNKHKRWLLPELIKEGVQRNHAQLQDLEQTSEPVKNYQKQSDKLCVTVVERHASSFVGSSCPDCFSLTSNYPSSPSNPVRNSTRLHAHVSDLKAKPGPEQEPELYYEFLSPFPKKNWPNHRELVCRYTYGIDGVTGSKSRKKTKGMRNKHYRHGVPLDKPADEQMFNHFPLDISTEKVHQPEESSSEQSSSALPFPIGTYIHDIIQRKASKKKKNQFCPSCNSCEEVPPHPVHYGKGDAIYIDMDGQYSKFAHPSSCRLSEQEEVENVAMDKKANIQLFTEDIHPDNLTHEFGNNYHEGDICPRKFIIKADLNKLSPNVFTSTLDCCLLFELDKNHSSSCLPAIINAQVTLSLPKSELLTEGVSKNIESELKRLKLDGPLSVKGVTNIVTEKIIEECMHTIPPKDIHQKNKSDVAKIPIELIQKICQQKPEVCEIKKAVQYSKLHTAVEEHDTVKTKLPDNSYCGICLSNAEEDLSEAGLSSFTRLDQCAHEFCNECWKQYINSCIRAGQGCISCPNLNCKTTINEVLVWSSTNSELYQRYCKLHYQLAINANPALRFCPAPECVHLAYVPSRKRISSNPLPIFCHCGKVWCFECQNDAHWPASCEEAEVFRKQHGNYEALRKASFVQGRITSVLVKRCPLCFYPIDKNEGCNHMTCRCGNNFCWECLKSSDNHGLTCADKINFEEVELIDVMGNARYNRYFKIYRFHFLERSGKKLIAVRKLSERPKLVENSHRLVSDSESVSCSRFVRSFVKSNISSLVEEIFFFKYLAHFVLENTAMAMAVSKHKTMLGRLDVNIQRMGFIVDRFNEVLSEPVVLTDEGKSTKVKELLKSEKQVIRIIHALLRANRKN